MQNRYVGDIGDYGKYSLLKALAGSDLSLGILWYLNEAEEENGDGRYTTYPTCAIVTRPCSSNFNPC